MVFGIFGDVMVFGFPGFFFRGCLDVLGDLVLGLIVYCIGWHGIVMKIDWGCEPGFILGDFGVGLILLGGSFGWEMSIIVSGGICPGRANDFDF